MPKFKIRHVTRYLYEDTVRDSANQVMLYPIEDAYQELVDQTLIVSGDPMIDNHVDYFGNKVGTFTHAQPHKELTIDSQLIVSTKTRPTPSENHSIAEQWEVLKKLPYQIEFIDVTRQERFNALPEVEMILAPERSLTKSPQAVAQHFSEYIYHNFDYRKGITTVETTIDEIWKLRSGVCQDFAHMLLAMLRLMNIPARYVSGYICPNKPGMRGEGATHAWVEAYIPFYGWLGFDPTNNCIANETHVRLAVGKNFTDCSPVKGTYRGTSHHTLDVTVTVSYEDGNTQSADHEITLKETAVSNTSREQNSFRRFQEMQMQQ
ncbi:transglutaminase family protein [Pseudochryseolinea flava]|uniref:Transglutaminase family protein n=1 Tax=Pseudochryseolinea flava TaxID=2059302 RepID=A0A364XZ24_9BACT|nr:transglutaminase family protein [Pseudochryseolinea flava]RAV99596.1 transglutaminase family protein [Pseudochryseolinea flava]